MEDAGVIIPARIMLAAHEAGHGWAAFKTAQTDGFTIGVNDAHGWTAFEKPIGKWDPMAIITTALTGPLVSQILGGGPLPPDITSGALFRLAVNNPSATDGVMDTDGVHMLSDRDLVSAAIAKMRQNREREDLIMAAVETAVGLAARFAEDVAYFVVANYSYWDALSRHLDDVGMEPDPETGGERGLRFEGEAFEHAIKVATGGTRVPAIAQRAVLPPSDTSGRKLGMIEGPLPDILRKPEDW